MPITNPTIRPGDFLIGGDGERAVIKIVELTGHESIVVLEPNGHRLVSRVGNEVKLRVGEQAPVQLRPSKLHLFLTADGERVNTDLDIPNGLVQN